MPDELEIIESVLRYAAILPKSYSRIGDDVAVIPVREGKLVLKTDMLVQSTDVPRGMTFRQAARKAVAMCVSDFAAKGVKPDSFMISLGVSKAVSPTQVKEISFGLRDAAREWGIRLIGGDTSEAGELTINCVMVGFANDYVARMGAEPGDAVVTTGRFGYPPAGLKILQKRAASAQRFRETAVESVMRPTPNLNLGLALRRFFTSSVDSSDGLARSLHILSRANELGIEIRNLPIGEGVLEFAKMNGCSASRLVFEGGEEYLIVGTMKRRRLAEAAGIAKRNGGELVEIGMVTRRTKSVILSARQSRRIADAGWVHLR